MTGLSTQSCVLGFWRRPGSLSTLSAGTEGLAHASHRTCVASDALPASGFGQQHQRRKTYQILCSVLPTNFSTSNKRYEQLIIRSQGHTERGRRRRGGRASSASDLGASRGSPGVSALGADRAEIPLGLVQAALRGHPGA